MTSTINREAADKTKGFRLQKLRAARLAFQLQSEDHEQDFYIANEVIEDVAGYYVEDGELLQYVEEDKHYPTSKFTINSDPVKNTLVSFFDIYVGKTHYDTTTVFGFYTTAEIGMEKKNCLQVCDKKIPILKSVVDGNLDDEILSILKNVLVGEYRKQYAGKKGGYLSELEQLSLSDFREFIRSIRWYFSEEDHVQIEKECIGLIKKSEFHTVDHEGREKFILSYINDLIDKKQHATNYLSRFLTSPEVKLAYRESLHQEPDNKKDAAYIEWESVEKPDDIRILSEKILAVAPSYNERRLKQLVRKACLSKLDSAKQSNSYKSLLYRVYLACEDRLCDIAEKRANEKRDFWVDVDTVIKEMVEISTLKLNDLSTDYTYPRQSEESVTGIVLDLIDSCYLAFE